MSNEDLLLLKNKFLAWAIKWTTAVNDNIEEIQFGLPDMVKILGALGFQVRDIDGCDPQDITDLKNGKRGMRIILTCLFSGQRYYLEKPIEKDSVAVIESSNNTDTHSSNHSKPCETSVEELTSRETCNDKLNIKDESLEEFYTSVKKVNSELAIAISRLEKVSFPKISKKATSTSKPNFSRQHSQRQSKSTKPTTPQNPQLSTRTKSSPNLFRNRSFVKVPKSKLLSVKSPEITKSKSNDDLKTSQKLTEAQSKLPLSLKYSHVKSTIPKAAPLRRKK